MSHWVLLGCWRCREHPAALLSHTCGPWRIRGIPAPKAASHLGIPPGILAPQATSPLGIPWGILAPKAGQASGSTPRKAARGVRHGGKPSSKAKITSETPKPQHNWGYFFSWHSSVFRVQPGSPSYSQGPPSLSSGMCSSVPTPPAPSVPSPQSHTRISIALGASASGLEPGERNAASLLKRSEGKVSGRSELKCWWKR